MKLRFRLTHKRQQNDGSVSYQFHADEKQRSPSPWGERNPIGLVALDRIRGLELRVGQTYTISVTPDEETPS